MVICKQVQLQFGRLVRHIENTQQLLIIMRSLEGQNLIRNADNFNVADAQRVVGGAVSKEILIVRED